MRHLDPVVEIPALPVFDAGYNLSLRGGVAAQLVRDDHPRHVSQPLQQLAEEPFGCLRAAPALYEDVEHMPVLVDRAPEIMQLALNADEHLIEEPLVPRSRTPPLQRVGKQPAEA